jgi:hypothetical protein
MSNSWIKLYIEILEDPKMSSLPSNLWRLTVELFLLAGKTGKDGQLPPVEVIAWELRRDTQTVQIELKQLTETGIITETADGWIVTNFAVRQAWSYSSHFGPGYIYLMRRPQDGAFKIGLSRQPKVRLLQIQKEFPGTELIHLIEAGNMGLAEAKLHKEYSEYRIDGEWFTLPPLVVEIITQESKA